MTPTEQIDSQLDQLQARLDEVMTKLVEGIIEAGKRVGVE